MRYEDEAIVDKKTQSKFRKYVQVAEQANFAAAAGDLRTSLDAVSGHVSALEARIASAG